MLGTNLGNLHTPPSFIALMFQNNLEDPNDDTKKVNGNDLSTLCRNYLVSFHSLTLEFTRLESLHQRLITTAVSLTTFVMERRDISFLLLYAQFTPRDAT